MVIQTDALNVFAGQWAGASIAAMATSSRPTAVFCANDLMALGGLQFRHARPLIATESR